MSREEEKYKAATESWNKQGFKNQEQKIPYKLGFLEGVDYADQHPREGLWDAEKVCKYLENHAGHYMTLENDEDGELQSVFYQKGLVEDLRKAMED